VDALVDGGVKKDEAIFQVLKKYIEICKPIRFDGNGYSQEWIEEAARRGLTNITCVPEALEAYLSESSKELFMKMGIFNEKELEGRAEVEFEKYTKKIQIEARVLGDLAMNHIVPTAMKYQTQLIENVKGLKDLFGDEFKVLAGNRMDIIREISAHVTGIKTMVREMIEDRKVVNKIEDGKEKAYAYDKKVRPYLEDIRYHIDKLELIIDDELWPLPKYRELLFNR
jgi:glutamine synthetase